MKRMHVIALFAAGLLLASPLFALDGRTVMQMASDTKAPEYTHTLVTMDLIEKDGSSQSRVMEEWGRDKDGETSAVIVFRSPASVKNTRFLQVVHEGGGSDKWIYLPSLKSTRRIASSEGSKSFMGSDATYDDMSDRDVDDDTHELLSESDGKNGYTCYQVKSTPKDAGSSQYLYRISWVDHETNLPVYVEMYDKKGELLKVLSVDEIKDVEGYHTPMVDSLKNVQTGHSTKITITNIEVDKPVPSKVFTQNFLSTGKV
jgi:hypothetical protein